MGIRVDAAKAVSINDTNEDGVDTSIGGNPTRTIIKGLEIHHIFSRNGKGGRRDDGNPLIHALKAQKGFTITPFWRQQLFGRARAILQKLPEDIKEYDHCLAVPSSSPFCLDVTQLISEVLDVPILAGAPLRKASVGEVLADVAASPPKVRPAMKAAYTSQINTWQKIDPIAICQAKVVNTTIRHLFRFMKPSQHLPDLSERRVIVIDDILSSGSSILSAREFLTNQLGAKVTGITFLGAN